MTDLTEHIGVIRSVRIGRLCGPADRSMGVKFDLGSGGGTGWCTGAEFCGYGWDDRLAYVMEQANVVEVGGLVGKPVRAKFKNGCLYVWDILTECVL